MESDQLVSPANDELTDDTRNTEQSAGVNKFTATDNDVNVAINSPVANLPQSSHIYRQDVVSRNEGNMIGVVTEVGGDSESESDITDDDSDDDDSDNDSDDSDNDSDDDSDNDSKEEAENDGETKTESRPGEDDGKIDVNFKSDIAGSVKSEDSSESGEEELSRSDRKRDPLTTDQVRVLWMDDSETIQLRNELTVADRGFLHGDYVASALDPSGQVGLVVDVNISVDLFAPDGSIVKDVSSKDLKRVRNITDGDYVVSGPWLGRVDDVIDNVTVLFDDGSVCKVNKADPLQLQPITKNLLEDGHCPYHPGQRVKASDSSILKNVRWLSGVWKKSKVEGTVMKVTVGSVYVHWIASAGYGPDSSTPPPEEQYPKNLKLLSCFTHANWQLGDWCLLPSLPFSSSVPLAKGLSKLRIQEANAGPSECDAEDAVPDESNGPPESMDHDGAGPSESTEKNAQNNDSPKSNSCDSSLYVAKDNVNEGRHFQRKKLRKVLVKREKKVRKKEENFERALLIVNTRTTLDVAWQDGTVERGVKSTLLIPVESPGDHDFVAEQYVVEKAVDDGDDTSEVRRVGVVRSVNAKEKTALVRWLKQVARPDDLREFEKEEVVSVYELEGHPDFDYCYGDVVVRLSPVPVATEGPFTISGEEQMQPGVSNGVLQNSGKHSDAVDGNVSAEDTSSDFSDLSWVGNITGLRNGDIEVTWADGMVSTVGPQAIYVVGRDDDESIVAGSELSDDAASWETLEDDEMDALDNRGKEHDAEGTDADHEAGEDVVVEESNPGNGPIASAIGFMTRLASGIFSRGLRHGDSFGSDSSADNEIEEEIHISDGTPSQDPSVIDIDEHMNPECGEKAADMVSNKSVDVSEAVCDQSDFAGGSYSFRRFDTAKDPCDHFFSANISGNNGRKWLKKVQRDWNILQNNLPDGIYVRVYEDRMDLLRAVIVGAYGTPYQDGLFFFDFFLPPEYPDVPPSAHYHSGGWRINPNLYEEGKVCLSLLNTWTGRGNEVWDPQSSSILQVLVSLQGLVLNSKPYFNEAGYDKQVGTAEGEKNSLSYNENTFLLNCKTIMYLIRKPPKDFEDLIKEHFKHRGYYILKACEAYMKGYLIGSLAKDASMTDKSESNATSVGFKLMMAKIVPKLCSTLSEAGVDCHEFQHLQQL